MLLRLMALAKEAERRARFFGRAWVERWRVCVPYSTVVMPCHSMGKSEPGHHTEDEKLYTYDLELLSKDVLMIDN